MHTTAKVRSLLLYIDLSYTNCSSTHTQLATEQNEAKSTKIMQNTRGYMKATKRINLWTSASNEKHTKVQKENTSLAPGFVTHTGCSARKSSPEIMQRPKWGSEHPNIAFYGWHVWNKRFRCARKYRDGGVWRENCLKRKQHALWRRQGVLFKILLLRKLTRCDYNFRFSRKTE